MFLQVLIIAVIVTAFSFLFLGFNIFFRKKKFPATSVGKNKEMAKRGIYCVKCEENKNFRKRKKIIIKPSKLKVIPQ